MRLVILADSPGPSFSMAAPTAPSPFHEERRLERLLEFLTLDAEHVMLLDMRRIAPSRDAMSTAWHKRFDSPRL